MRSCVGSASLDVARLHGDAPAVPHGLEGVLEDLHERLLHFGLVELGREQLAVQLQRPGHRLRPGVLLKELHAALQQQIEIAGGLGARLLLLAAEGAQVVGDFRRLGRRFLDFEQRAAPGMVRLHLAQDQRGVAQDARQRVVEIQRHGAGQLQRAVQLLLVRQARICPGRFGFRPGRLAG